MELKGLAAIVAGTVGLYASLVVAPYLIPFVYPIVSVPAITATSAVVGYEAASSSGGKH